MRKVIIDTDIGCDCDDAGALAVAHALEARGNCELLAMTHCTSRVNGCSAIDIINRRFGRDDIPIGKLQAKGVLEIGEYAAYLKEHFPSRYQRPEDCPDAVSVLRRALAGLDEGEDAVLVGIGPMVNLSNLLASPPDVFSPLSGIELLTAKQCSLVVMACCFDIRYYPMIEDKAEWNIFQDISAAQRVYQEWPAEIFTVPFETGVDIQTGVLLKNLPVTDPVRVSYEQFLKGSSTTRSSWDQCAVGFAINPQSKLWTLSESGSIIIRENGESVFKPCEEGKHYIVGAQSREKAQSAIEELMVYRPSVREKAALI